jgi:ribonuclease-3
VTRQKNNYKSFLEDNKLSFNNKDLLITALTHPSYYQERSSAEASNQRLEFLGDAVLNLIVGEYIYKNFSDKAEGELTKIRARVVCESALVMVAKKLSLGSYIFLGRGEEMSGGRKRKSILADTVEAVIGAIYLDQGLESAEKFVLKYLEDEIFYTAQGDYYDYKSRLQEFVQAWDKENVYYDLLEEHGPAHSKTFTMAVYYKGEKLASGSGRTKQEAEQKAAEEALNNNDFVQNFINEQA